MKDNHGSNMLLIKTFWGPTETLKMMPVNNDCPYMEVIYDINTQMLVALCTNMKENYELLPKLDDDGEMIRAKKSKSNGRPFKEERRLMKVPQEFYLIDRAEQEAFIEKFAVNADTFDYKKFLDMKPKTESNVLQEQKSEGLLDSNGMPLKKV